NNLHTNPKKNKLLKQIKTFINNIKKIKKKIKIKLTLNNIIKYKNTIKSFLNFYINNILQYKNIISHHPHYKYSQKITIIKQTKIKLN
ncbi:DUF327 family protein, partial [Klebsiella pneumoniae]|uniref:DUF327 family protein n=1 Tax=Klebsiella pneumoniae TaxID=573 RepID=UPI00272F357C